MFNEFDHFFNDQRRNDPFRMNLNLYDRPYDQLDPFRNIDRYQNVFDNPFRNEDLQQDGYILRGTENSYVTKINYDKDGNPTKEALQTKVFHANDRGKKIMET